MGFIPHCSQYEQGWNEESAARIGKIQSYYLSHCSQREGMIGKLEENGYAYLQTAVGHSLKKIFHGEIKDVISNPTEEWKWFNHSPGAEYLPLPMVCTCDLEQSFNLQVPFFGSIMKSWICDIFPYNEFSVPYIFRCEYILNFLNNSLFVLFV